MSAPLLGQAVRSGQSSFIMSIYGFRAAFPWLARPVPSHLQPAGCRSSLNRAGWSR
jgi:hypothetical protein